MKPNEKLRAVVALKKMQNQLKVVARFVYENATTRDEQILLVLSDLLDDWCEGWRPKGGGR